MLYTEEENVMEGGREGGYYNMTENVYMYIVHLLIQNNNKWLLHMYIYLYKTIISDCYLESSCMFVCMALIKKFGIIKYYHLLWNSTYVGPQCCIYKAMSQWPVQWIAWHVLKQMLNCWFDACIWYHMFMC